MVWRIKEFGDPNHICPEGRPWDPSHRERRSVVSYAEAVEAIKALAPGQPGDILRDELRILESHLSFLAPRRPSCWLRKQHLRLIAAYLHLTSSPA
jgi:hypothetical protein